MNRWSHLKRAFVGVTFASVLAGSSLFGPWAGTAVVAAPSQEWSAPSNLDSCFQTNHLMAVELLIDRTGSLQQTDPNAERVDFAQAVVSAFSSIAARNDGQIQVQATAFGVGTSTVIPFQQLTPATAPSVSTELEQFKNLNHDQSTDYVTALGQAQSDLTAQANAMSPQTSGASVCKVLVWLTDGNFDVAEPGFFAGWASPPTVVTASNAASISATGVNRLCAPGGSADALRSNGIFVFAVGLASSEQPDFSLLSGIAVGNPVAGSTASPQLANPCGADQAQAASSGAFYAGSVSQLVLQLVSPLISTPPPAQQTVSCSISQGPCSWSFTTYPHTVGATFLLLPQGVGPITLSSPTGISLPLTPGQKESSGNVTVDTGAGQYPFVSLTFGGTPTATGPVTWTVSAPAEMPNASLGYTVPALDFGLRLVPTGSEPNWERGRTSKTDFVIRWNGMPLPQSVVAQASLTGTVAVGAGPALPVSVSPPDSANVVSVPYLVPPGDPSTQAVVSVNGQLTLAASEGGGQVPVSASWRPSISVSGVPAPPSSIALGLIHARGSTTVDSSHGLIGHPVTKTVEVPVHGAVGDAGRFCFEAAPVVPTRGPTGAVDQSCASVPFGAVVEVPLTVTISRPFAGSLAGAFVTAYASASQTPDVHKPFRIALTGVVELPPIPTTTDQGTFWALVISSILLALLIWAGASLVTARLKSPESVMGWRSAVRIRPGTTHIEALPKDPGRWRYLGPASGRFGLRTDFNDDNSNLALRARVHLLGVQDVVVARTDHIAYGSLGAVGGRGLLTARIAHKIQGEWVFTVPVTAVIPEDDEEQGLQGDLFFFVRDGAVSSESDPSGVFASAQRGVVAAYPEIVKRLRSAQAVASRRRKPDGEADRKDPSPEVVIPGI